VAVVLVSFFGAVAVASPLWIAIVLGGVMAICVHRPYELIRRRLGGARRSSWAAAVTTLATGLVVAGAGSLILMSLTTELMKLVARLQTTSGSLSGLIGPRAAHAFESIGIDTAHLYEWAQSQIEAIAGLAASATAVIVRTTSHALLSLVVALLSMYYFLIEGPGLAQRIERIAPLDPRHTSALFSEAREVARTAFIGSVATAIVQGLLAGVGYVVLDVPAPVTWAVVTGLASFLPVIGTLIVWVPLSGYLFFEGHPIRALILVLYGIFVITSLADYVIRPRIVGVHGHGHPLLTLISLLGGIELFGLAGLVIAPIIMSVFVAAFRLYEREVRIGWVSATTPSVIVPSATTPSGIVPSATTTASTSSTLPRAHDDIGG
jgi:predicted PurR-regulated permease PerM